MAKVLTILFAILAVSSAGCVGTATMFVEGNVGDTSFPGGIPGSTTDQIKRDVKARAEMSLVHDFDKAAAERRADIERRVELARRAKIEAEEAVATQTPTEIHTDRQVVAQVSDSSRASGSNRATRLP